MELATNAELYCLTVNDAGVYVDTCGAFKANMRCPCASRKDKVYTSLTAWKSHIKTDMHMRWVAEMNANRANHYMELVALRELVASQRIIIARLDRDLAAKSKIVDLINI